MLSATTKVSWSRSDFGIGDFSIVPQVAHNFRNVQPTIIGYPDNSLFASFSGTIKLWNWDGRLLRTFFPPLKSSPLQGFSSDGTKLIAIDSQKINIWGVFDNSLIVLDDPGPYTLGPQSFSITADNKYLISQLNFGVRIWDLASQQIRNFFPASSGIVSNPLRFANKAVFMPGTHIAAIAHNNEISLWNVDTDKTLWKKKLPILIKTISPDKNNRALIVTDVFSTTTLSVDISGLSLPQPSENSTFPRKFPEKTVTASGQIAIIRDSRVSVPLRVLPLVSPAILSATISTKYNLFAMADSRGVINVWKLKTLSPYKKLNPSGKWAPIGAEVVFSKTGNLLATTAIKNDRIIVYDVTSWREKSYILENSGNLDKIAISPNNEFLAAAVQERGEGGTILIWDVASGKSIYKHRVKRVSPDRNIYDLHFREDGKSLISRYYNETETIWSDSATVTHSTPIKTITDDDSHPPISISVEFDGERAELFNSRTNQKLFISYSGEDWIAYTPDGYFDASLRGAELLAMVKGRTAYDIDQFASLYNRPDIMLERLGLGTPDQLSLYQQRHQRRLNRLGLSAYTTPLSPDVPEVVISSIQRNDNLATIYFSATDLKYGLKSYMFFANNVPVPLQGKSNISGSKFAGRETIELIPGTNKIDVSVINSLGIESYRATKYIENPLPSKSEIYFLGFGISKYKDPELNLNFADKDAQDLGNTFLEMQRKNATVHVHISTNAEVTRETIRSAKHFFKNAGANDVAIVFFAGHGGYDTSSASPMYYYLPHEANQNDIAATGVPFDTIEHLLSEIAPRRKLLLLDTCESGEYEDAYDSDRVDIATARGIKPRTNRRRSKPLVNDSETDHPDTHYRPSDIFERDRMIHRDISRRVGAIIFTSSRGGEASYEGTSARNGFFTSAIITALHDSDANKNHDGGLSISELKEYVIDSVIEATGDLQHPSLDRDNTFQNIQLPTLARYLGYRPPWILNNASK